MRIGPLEIRHKLTLQFTGLVALLLLAILSFNYYLAFRFAQESFFERLEEKAVNIGDHHLGGFEKKSNSNRKLSGATLHSELIQVYSPDGVLQYSTGKGFWAPGEDFFTALNQQGYFTSVENGRHIVGLPLRFEGEKYFVVASAIDEVGASKLRNMAETMLVSFLFFLVFVVIAGHYLARKALEPIKSVINQVQQITGSNLNRRVVYDNNKDEIAQLSATFNSMLARLEDSFHAQADFVRNSSHELRNPLAAMIGQAEIALIKERDAAYYKDVIKAIFEESLRLKHIVNSLLHLSKASRESESKWQEEIRLDELLFDAAENLTKADPGRQIDVRIDQASDHVPLVMANRSLLEIAIGNLLENACKYSGNARVTCSIYEEASRLKLGIEDKGIGMTEDEIHRMSEPFFRSPSVRKREGFGIGMAVAVRVFQVHGIRMKIQSQPGMGTRVELEFPEKISGPEVEAE